MVSQLKPTFQCTSERFQQHCNGAISFSISIRKHKQTLLISRPCHTQLHSSHSLLLFPKDTNILAPPIRCLLSQKGKKNTFVSPFPMVACGAESSLPQKLRERHFPWPRTAAVGGRGGHFQCAEACI